MDRQSKQCYFYPFAFDTMLHVESERAKVQAKRRREGERIVHRLSVMGWQLELGNAHLAPNQSSNNLKCLFMCTVQRVDVAGWPAPVPMCQFQFYFYFEF